MKDWHVMFLSGVIILTFDATDMPSIFTGWGFMMLGLLMFWWEENK